MSDWQTLSSEDIYETPWIKVRRDEVLNHNGKHLTYSVVSLHHPSVFILAVNADGEILIQKTFRYTIGKTIFALPAGHSDGQDPLVAAKRELLEESSLESNDWVQVGKFYQAIGVANFPYFVFVARGVHSVQDNIQDDLEDISEQTFMSLEKIEQLIRSGDFDDTPTIAAIYSAKIQGLIGE
ncbi:MAG TPA: NUDIX hydrolase [Patescibacteria group bacterium]|nr:NUDIX hydrolase [Patescibacteria group bacterium]